jgi:hypothetical protein
VRRNYPKLGAGMFLKAVIQLNIDLPKSMMVINKISIVGASAKANTLSKYLLSSSYINLDQRLKGKLEIISDLPATVMGLKL